MLAIENKPTKNKGVIIVIILKKSLSLITVTILVLLICSSMVMAKPEYLIKLGITDPPDLDLADEYPMSYVFKSIVESKTGGAIQVEIYPSGQLGKEVELLENTQVGIIQSCITCSGPMTTFVPEYNVVAIPFLFPNNSVAWGVLDGWFGKELNELILQKTGLKVLAIAEDGGFTAVTNSKRPIKTPEDMKGLNMRTEEHPAHMEFTKAVGAGVTPIAWAELYTSLQTGVVDGQYNAIPIIKVGHLYEVQKYLTKLDHIYNTDIWVMNNKFFNSLPEKYQKIVLEAANAANIAGRGVTQISTATGEEFLVENGVEIYTPTVEERNKFKEIAQPAVIEWFKSEVGEEWLNKALKATKEEEGKLYTE